MWKEGRVAGWQGWGGGRTWGKTGAGVPGAEDKVLTWLQLPI